MLEMSQPVDKPSFRVLRFITTIEILPGQIWTMSISQTFFRNCHVMIAHCWDYCCNLSIMIQQTKLRSSWWAPNSLSPQQEVTSWPQPNEINIVILLFISLHCPWTDSVGVRLSLHHLLFCNRVVYSLNCMTLVTQLQSICYYLIFRALGRKCMHLLLLK